MFVGCAPAILRPSGLLSALRPQDVFATSLYTGNNTARSITNGIDLAGKSGLAWIKARSSSFSHYLYDTARGTQIELSSNTTSAESNGLGTLTSFNANGFSLGSANGVNSDTVTYSSWSFRRAPKFFDIVTYTGDGTSGRAIPHALGIKPGMIIVKNRGSSGYGWPVYHRTLGAPAFLNLSGPQVSNTASDIYAAEPTAAGFTVGSSYQVNGPGETYVAYLFAHDPDTTNGIVQCGSFTTDGEGNGSFTLPWSPQWIVARQSSIADSWILMDTARGFDSSGYVGLAANTAAAEVSKRGSYSLNGNTVFVGLGANTSGVYCAIRAPIT